MWREGRGRMRPERPVCAGIRAVCFGRRGVPACASKAWSVCAKSAAFASILARCRWKRRPNASACAVTERGARRRRQRRQRRDRRLRRRGRRGRCGRRGQRHADEAEDEEHEEQQPPCASSHDRPQRHAVRSRSRPRGAVRAECHRVIEVVAIACRQQTDGRLRATRPSHSPPPQIGGNSATSAEAVTIVPMPREGAAAQADRLLPSHRPPRRRQARPCDATMRQPLSARANAARARAVHDRRDREDIRRHLVWALAKPRPAASDESGRAGAASVNAARTRVTAANGVPFADCPERQRLARWEHCCNARIRPKSVLAPRDYASPPVMPPTRPLASLGGFGPRRHVRGAACFRALRGRSGCDEVLETRHPWANDPDCASRASFARSSRGAPKGVTLPTNPTLLLRGWPP